MSTLKVKYDYYLRIRHKVEDLIGSRALSIKKYQQQYENEIHRQPWKIGNKKDLFRQLARSEVIFIGDFHAQAQSARAVLRIARKVGSKNVVLGLECFKSEHQQNIDLFLQGQLGEKEFLKKIEWNKNWGFPWEFTRPLMKWASQNKIPVIALNAGSSKSLSDQDKFAAQLIAEAIKTYPERKIVVQYGDFHLASYHLPYQLRKLRPKVVDFVLLQSPEKLFFKILEKQIDPSVVDFVQLTSQRWAVMSVVPWVKWQDYLLYLETGHDKKIKVLDYDLTDHVLQAVQILIKSLALEKDVLKKINTDDLSVYSMNDEVFLNKIQKMPSADRAYYKELILSAQSFYCPELQFGFVARPSLNHVSRVAALYVLYKLGIHKKTILDPRKDFLKMIWLEMLTYYLTKIINPKKKTDTFDDIRNALRSENFSDKGKDTLILALEQKLNEVRFATFQDLSFVKKNAPLKSKKVYFSAAQILGGIMGEKIYTAYQKKIFKLSLHRSLIFKDIHHKYFNQAYYESVEVIDSWPTTFKSKFDKY